MGPNERKALKRERNELAMRPALSQLEGRRLDQIDKLLGEESSASTLCAETLEALEALDAHAAGRLKP